jgi:Protein of unknown function (DUF4238)
MSSGGISAVVTPRSSPTSSAPKRHHYVPRFLLRRFAEDSETKRPMVWWLNKKTGQNERRSVENEAVIGRYYQLSEGDELPREVPEKMLSDVEGVAAAAIRSLEEHPQRLDFEERLSLALFIVLQRKRTPNGRRYFKFADELLGRLATEANLHEAESWAAAMRAIGEFESPEQAEHERLETLRAFQEGRVTVETTTDGEIRGMFLAAVEVALVLTRADFSWYLLRAEGERRFVLGDDPVAFFDPSKPETPGGLGFATSRVESTLPLSPTTCLLLRKEVRGQMGELGVGDRSVRHINLRTYAHAEQCIWGSRQLDVATVRKDAKSDRELLHAVRRRDPVLWLATESDEESNMLEFEGHAPDGVRRRQRAWVDRSRR